MPAVDRSSLRARRLIAAERFAIAIIGVTALASRFRWGLGSATFEPANFFGYLTVQSNTALVAIMAISGFAALRGRHLSRIMVAARGAVLACVVTSGIVFAVIVQQSAQLGIRVDVPWSDIVLHFVVPLLAVADWILVPRLRPPLRIVVYVLGYVAVWGVLTIIRGALVDWYPYYFLDPRQLESPLQFIAMSGIAVGVFTVVCVALVLVPPRDLREFPDP